MSKAINELKKTKDFLVCVDSDGCVFDNMELKHKECFCPATVNCWGLQGVSKYAREAAEFVNLYSKTRGMNRFPAVIRTLKLTYSRPEVIARGYKMPDLSSLENWVASTKNLSATALREYLREDKHKDPILQQALVWCDEVDGNVRHIVRGGVPPFVKVKSTLARLSEFADIVVVSATPHEALTREWEEQGLLEYVVAVCGQEVGPKSVCIDMAKAYGYDAEKTVMVGDAIGDFEAARKNGVWFYPIIPTREDDSWAELEVGGAQALKRGDAAYFADRFSAFDAMLKETPDWEA